MSRRICQQCISLHLPTNANNVSHCICQQCQQRTWTSLHLPAMPSMYLIASASNVSEPRCICQQCRQCISPHPIAAAVVIASFLFFYFLFLFIYFSFFHCSCRGHRGRAVRCAPVLLTAFKVRAQERWLCVVCVAVVGVGEGGERWEPNCEQRHSR